MLEEEHDEADVDNDRNQQINIINSEYDLERTETALNVDEPDSLREIDLESDCGRSERRESVMIHL